MNENSIPDAGASDKMRTPSEDARAWVKQHFDRGMFNTVCVLADVGLVELPQLFYSNVISRDGFAHRDTFVLVHPGGEGSWHVSHYNDGGGMMFFFSTKQEAIAEAMEYVRRDNAEMRISNQPFPTKEEWERMHD